MGRVGLREVLLSFTGHEPILSVKLHNLSAAEDAKVQAIVSICLSEIWPALGLNQMRVRLDVHSPSSGVGLPSTHDLPAWVYLSVLDACRTHTGGLQNHLLCMNWLGSGVTCN